MNDNTVNNIPTEQNSEPFLRLLRARQHIYFEATRLQIVQFVVIIFPIFGALIGLCVEPARPWIAAGALLFLILDTAWLDRAERTKLKTAAKISEQFDCDLLKMNWNQFAAGKQPDPELIEAAAQSYKQDEQRIQNWYPNNVGKVPLHIARIICQRTNLWYDSELRCSYGKLLILCAAVLFAGLLVIGFAANLKLIDFVAIVLTPSAPVLIWALRENFRQRDVAEAAQIVKLEAEVLFDGVKAGTCDEVACTTKSRELQDAIYRSRATSPLIFPLIYKILRPEMEVQMNAGADAFMKSLGSPTDRAPRAK